MIKYDPVQHLPMGSRTLGTMEASSMGDWVHVSDYEELRSDLAVALSWIEDGKGCDPDHEEAMDQIVNPLREKHGFSPAKPSEPSGLGE